MKNSASNQFEIIFDPHFVLKQQNENTEAAQSLC